MTHFLRALHSSAVAALSYFYVSTWETYHTGTLYLGYINGPVEGTLMVCLIYMFTGYVGRAFWLQPVVNLVGTELGGLLTGMRVNEASTVAFAFITLLMMTSSFYNMLAFAFRTRANVFVMYGNLFPIFAIIAGSGAWLWATRAPIITGHILALTLALGLEFCMSVVRALQMLVALVSPTAYSRAMCDRRASSLRI